MPSIGLVRSALIRRWRYTKVQEASTMPPTSLAKRRSERDERNCGVAPSTSVSATRGPSIRLLTRNGVGHCNARDSAIAHDAYEEWTRVLSPSRAPASNGRPQDSCPKIPPAGRVTPGSHYGKARGRREI